MKKFSLISLLFCLLVSAHLFAATGDTTLVTSHNNVYVVTNPSTGSNPYPLWAVFPSASTQYRKVILTLTHKCPPGLPCGEWDYIDNVFIRRVGGMNAASADIEVARYITPYGNSFNSSWGSSWTLDVTDYANFLHDSVEIEYIHTGYETNVNKGWSVGVSFSIIEGTPVMPPVAFQQLWKGSFPFGNAANPIENYLQADTILTNAATANLKLKVTQSGHGADAAYCAEFCSKNRSVYFDGALVNTKAVWRLCGRNPIYPQGGTWVYDRANWCPGNWVYPVNYKFNVTGGTTHIVDMNMQTYNTANPSANFVIDAQLYEFGALSNANDAAIDEVIEPNNKFEFSRMNPVCNNPRIRIKNNGSNAITSATFKYGLTGTSLSTYAWTGSLASLDTVQVILPGIITPVTGSQQFQVYIEDVNGAADQYAYDDTAYTTALINPVMDTTFVFWFKSNSAPNESSYKLWDENGNIVFQRLQGSLSANTVYKDTFYVAPGCYRFKFYDSGDDGLTWWANTAQGNGYARFSRTNVATQYIIFNSDFGSEISYNFRAVPGGTVGIDDVVSQPALSIYPNPSQGKVSVDIALTKPSSVTVEVLNQVGQIVSKHYEKNYTAGIIDMDLSKFDNGVYVVRLKTDDATKTEKIILQH
jgi:hypothetical protein